MHASILVRMKRSDSPHRFASEWGYFLHETDRRAVNITKKALTPPTLPARDIALVTPLPPREGLPPASSPAFSKRKSHSSLQLRLLIHGLPHSGTMVGFKYHQYQVVGRHLPKDAADQPPVYRMKIWAPDAVKARCVTRAAGDGLGRGEGGASSSRASLQPRRTCGRWIQPRLGAGRGGWLWSESW